MRDLSSTARCLFPRRRNNDANLIMFSPGTGLGYLASLRMQTGRYSAGRDMHHQCLDDLMGAPMGEHTGHELKRPSPSSKTARRTGRFDLSLYIRTSRPCSSLIGFCMLFGPVGKFRSVRTPGGGKAVARTYKGVAASTISKMVSSYFTDGTIAV